MRFNGEIRKRRNKKKRTNKRIEIDWMGKNRMYHETDFLFLPSENEHGNHFDVTKHMGLQQIKCEHKNSSDLIMHAIYCNVYMLHRNTFILVLFHFDESIWLVDTL